MQKYQVRPGDTLAKISYYNRIPVEDLLVHNRHICENAGYVKKGSILHLPSSNPGCETVPPSFGCFYEYGWRELESDRKRFSSSIRADQIGDSRMGKPLWSFSIGRGKKKIFFSGTWHGNEWLNTWLLMNFLEQLQEKERRGETWHHIDIRRLLENVTLVVVPLVNPDGAELVQEGLQEDHDYYETIHDINQGFADYRHWSANAVGVDLNHQWPAGWKAEAETSPQVPFFRHYGGEAPLTEPETRAIYQLTMEENFSHVLALHSQGEEIYWGYRDQEPDVSRELAERLAQASSFRAVQTADSKAGYKDWFIKEFRRPGFTIETGIGQNPLPFEAAARMWLTTIPLLLESCLFPDFTRTT
ncbi:M14 family metallopeptidase [Bacillus piscicola]|uniref:M14 family metallopeptidase n=1 Tax=Bacillus piscicola TaxID=1632684 RepID=UPI001F091B7C|nr:M14 family metallopeptidase [Bacillus piscicola]